MTKRASLALCLGVQVLVVFPIILSPNVVLGDIGHYINIKAVIPATPESEDTEIYSCTYEVYDLEEDTLIQLWAYSLAAIAEDITSFEKNPDAVTLIGENGLLAFDRFMSEVLEKHG